jgi:hypothetical protein
MGKAAMIAPTMLTIPAAGRTASTSGTTAGFIVAPAISAVLLG